MPKKTTTYFYSKKRDGGKYIVYEIEHDGDVDIADRKCKTAARNRGEKLAGGYFDSSCKPYDFKENYTVIHVPFSTRTSPYTKHDKFIIALIERESNMKYTLI